MRPAAAVTVLGIAVAVGVPATWEFTRPTAAAGPPAAQALAVPSTAPSAAPLDPAPSPGTVEPLVPIRQAAPAAPIAAPAPVRLEVPARGVTAAVDAVGVEPDGQMTVPAAVDRVGWYRFGPAPGEDGSAVLAGHVDSATQGLGALAPLRGAEPGDEVLVTDAAGATSRWRIVSRELIEKRALPLDQLFRRDGPPRLTLLTCGGPFLPEFGSYRDNLVVVAEPVP